MLSSDLDARLMIKNLSRLLKIIIEHTELYFRVLRDILFQLIFNYAN